MFGERGYMAFPIKAFAGKPPQGLLAWCCSCCRPKPRRDMSEKVRVQKYRTKIDSEEDSKTHEEVVKQGECSTSIGEVGEVPLLNVYDPPSRGTSPSTENIVQEEKIPEPKIHYTVSSNNISSEDRSRKWLFKKRRVSADESKLIPEQNVEEKVKKSCTLGSLGMRRGRAADIPTLKIYNVRGEEHVDDEDDASISEELPPVVLPPHSKSASPSPIVGVGGRKGPGSVSSGEWPASPEEDIDRLVAIHQQRSSLSSLGPRSDSLASVYSGAGEGRYGTVAVKGEVEFGLEYNYKAGALEIHVKQCRDLAPVDTKRNRSDPYVKVYLLPDKSKSGKRKTKVKKHTLNPVFDETLKFQMTLHGLETRTLWLTVWHSDMFGRNDFLGEVMMALENKVFDDPSPQWYPLQERTEPFDDLLSYKGDLIIGLKFVPPDVTSSVQKKGKRSSRGSLNVLIKEAKNLTAVKANGTSDPFCKSYLLPDKGRSSKQKTPVLRRTCSPVWNYTFVYEDVSLQELSERSLELTVWDHDRLASNEFLGGLRFNLGSGKHYGKAVDWMDATGKEVTLWQQMLERPNFWVEGCLTLRPSLEHRNSS